ncbi:MAG: Crp/Fnr family transcriptional regulator [Bacteroidetes bacterium]|nr:Crp/Fnr family transcriptional regulator [Bacteroidota bacterium]
MSIQLIVNTNFIFTQKELLLEIEKNARLKSFKQGEIVITPGQEILYIPIVIKGSIRILRQDNKGAEVFLYHLYPGQTCAVSLTCCQSGKKSMIKALAETKTEIIQIPVKQTEDWFKYPEWKAYISSNYNSRFEELMQVVDLIAFQQMDKQLLHYLEERSKALNTRVVELTHQQIADELHAHREAISRLLRVMEQKGLVKLGRNNIEVLTQK